ncbi:uncharacterized protein LOC117291741 isoform X3 [Asterias rubens]|uniref:uncharacterized protein LOC117291741 isoform X3 n=1 Tax=Asterias rubens TaxID=7604 RepID=UPI00145526AE|nr:uncharacterized protein LOC117291741 isoform X3 [Asterias rubens]
MSMMYTSTDAVFDDQQDDTRLAYRHLLVSLDNELGSEECRKLCFLAVDLGMSKSQTERVQQAIDVFTELESRLLISANDVSLLVEMMNLIHRKDLIERIQSLYNNRIPIPSKGLGHFSQFRVLLLEIADDTSRSELETMKHACIDLLGRQVISKLKDAIQLFLILEERGKLAPTNLKFLHQLLTFCDNRSMLAKLNTFDNINLDHRRTQDKIVAMLTAWRETVGKEAYQVLSKELKSCHRMDLAKKVEALAASKASVPASDAVPQHARFQPQPVYQQQQPVPVWPVQYQPVQYQPSQFSPTSLMVPGDFCVPPSVSPSVHTGLPDTTQHGYRTDPADDVLEYLSLRLAADWQKLGKLLEIDDATVMMIHSMYQDSAEKALEILKKWRNRLPLHKNATSTLASILKVSGWLDLSEHLKGGTESAANALAAQMQEMETTTSSGSTPLLQPGQMPGTNQDKTSTENLAVQSEGLKEGTYQQTPHVQGYRTDPADDVLEFLSLWLAADWQKLGKLLEIDDATMMMIHSMYQDSAEKALEILKKWRNRLPLHKNATSTLASILKVSGWPGLSEHLKGTEPAANALAAQMQEMETTTSSGSTPLLQPGQMPGTNQDKTSTENLAVQSEGLKEGTYQQTPHVQDHCTDDKTHTNLGTKPSQESYPQYTMNRNPRGLCMIINNQNFHGDKRLNERKGSDLDTGRLLYLFDKLHFKVDARTDMTSYEMHSWFKEVSQMDHSEYDCFVCCIMSHGELGAVHGTDGESVEIQEILALFKSVSCKSLNGKPKLFFIQACQGTVHQEGIETDEAPGLGTGIQKTLPKEADFLLSCATVPGYVSYRSTKSGSWFVNALVDNIEKYHDELDLVRILIQVNYQLGNGVAKVKQGYMKQIAAPSFTLRKDLYLRSLPT